MPDHATEDKAKQKPPPIADRGTKPTPKVKKLRKPIRDLRLMHFEPANTSGTKTRVFLPVGIEEGVLHGLDARLHDLRSGTFSIEGLEAHRSWGTVDQTYDAVKVWHKENGRAVVGE